MYVCLRSPRFHPPRLCCFYFNSQVALAAPGVVGFFKQKSRAIQTQVLSYENTLCLVRLAVSKIWETSFLTSKPRQHAFHGLPSC